MLNVLFFSAVILDEVNGELQILLKGASFVDGYVVLPEAFSTKDKIWFKRILVNGKEAELSTINEKMVASINKGDFELRLIINKNKSSELDHIDFDKVPLILVNKSKKQEFYKAGNQVRIIQQAFQEIESEQKIAKTELVSKEELQVNVYRKLTTDIPNYLTTKIKITYTGKAKDYHLGKVLPEGFEFLDARSSLKIEQKEDGFWIKLLPGENIVTINSFTLKNIDKVNVKNLISEINSEIWSLQQNQQIRQVEVNGVQSIDPKQSKVPRDWENLPAYAVNEELMVITNRRGIEEQKKLEINTQRTSYYGFNNDKMINLDTLQIHNVGEQFLSKSKDEAILENIKINGVSQIIVRNNDSIGIIIPKGDFSAQVQTITNGVAGTKLFEADTYMKNWSVHMAPRTSILATFGGDIKSSYGEKTWWDYWNLYSIFSIFVIVLAFYKLFGKITASLALIGLLTFQGEMFSWFLWLSFLLTLGLLKVLPNKNESDFAKKISLVSASLLIFFILHTLSFIKTELQLIINPSLENISYRLALFDSSNMFTHLIVIVLCVFAFNFTYGYKKDKQTFKTSLKKYIIYAIGCIFAYGIFSPLLTTNKETVFGSGSTVAVPAPAPMAAMPGEPAAQIMNEVSEMEAEEGVRSKSLDYSLGGRSAKTFSKHEINQSIINKYAQVGSGTPTWQGKVYNFTFSNSTLNAEIKMIIIPVWLTNLFSIFKILFLLLSVFLFGLGVIYLSDNKTLFEKLPLNIRNKKLIQVLLNNDLKKGF